jgi:MoxR-like ATPase
VRYPSAAAELEMLALHEAGFDPESAGRSPILDAVMTADEARACRVLADQVRVAPEVREYIAAIARATREDPSLILGASPRASVALMRAARAGAVLDGRDFATPDDVKARATSVLRHRILLAPELEVEGKTTDEVLAGVLARMVAPA